MVAACEFNSQAPCDELTQDLLWAPDGRPSFYSHENAPGIVMAVGNTGEFLDFAADAMCTWLSRDGGATWEDVAPNAVRPHKTINTPPLHARCQPRWCLQLCLATYGWQVIA